MGKRIIYSPYITLKNGKRIYRKGGKVFRFEVDDEVRDNDKPIPGERR